jgi:cellulose biosynthesis protein BcsQ
MLSHTAVAFYAHKGGVGKSTLIFDTAIRAAATHNRHVVIIDADSQLNTTFKLLGRLNISEAELNGRFIDALLTQDSAQLTVPLTLDGAAADRQFPTLFSYLCGAPNGPGGPNFDLDRDFLVVPGTQDKVKFLLGSPMLHSLELQLSNAINEPQNHPAAAHVPRLFLSLLQHIKAAYDRAGHDVLIFVDMSPSSNTMNQNILLSCDHFVLPVNADSNSMVSLRLLFSYLRRWRHVHRSYLGAHYVKFLFVVLNRYKVLDTETRETSNIVDKFQRRIVDMIQQFLKAQEPAPGGGGPRLVNADFILDHGPHLLKVQDGMRWVSFCSDTHRSVFEITSSICRQEMGRALSGRDGVKVDSLQQEIAAIASEILGRI